MNTDRILAEYRDGDESKRLSLFLAHRELRDAFERIEQESLHDDFTVYRFPWSRKRQVARAA